MRAETDPVEILAVTEPVVNAAISLASAAVTVPGIVPDPSVRITSLALKPEMLLSDRTP